MIEIMKQKDDKFIINQIGTTLAVFMESYNKNIPLDFPRASTGALKQFQATHPKLFGESGEWSIDKHRKRLMDWLVSHRDI